MFENRAHERRRFLDLILYDALAGIEVEDHPVRPLVALAQGILRVVFHHVPLCGRQQPVCAGARRGHVSVSHSR